MAASAVAPATASAQSDFRIGIGASVEMTRVDVGGDDEIAWLPIGGANLRVRIWIGSLRIEPEIGDLRLRVETRSSFDGETSSFDIAQSAFRIGTGIAWSFAPDESTRIYFGPRFGLIFHALEFEESDSFLDETFSEKQERSATDFCIGASVGGQAFLTKRFSLGIEAQINYVNLGEPEVERTPAEEEPIRSEFDGSILSTRALFLARFYFN